MYNIGGPDNEPFPFSFPFPSQLILVATEELLPPHTEPTTLPARKDSSISKFSDHMYPAVDRIWRRKRLWKPKTRLSKRARQGCRTLPTSIFRRIQELQQSLQPSYLPMHPRGCVGWLTPCTCNGISEHYCQQLVSISRWGCTMLMRLH